MLTLLVFLFLRKINNSRGTISEITFSPNAPYKVFLFTLSSLRLPAASSNQTIEESVDDLESASGEKGLLHELAVLNLNQIKEIFGKVVMQFETKDSNSEQVQYGSGNQNSSPRNSLLLESGTGGAQSSENIPDQP